MSRAAGLVGGLVFLLCCNFSVAFAQPAVPERQPGGQNGGACATGSPVVSPAVPWPSTTLGVALAGQFSKGRGITVAVVDTGVGATATALAGAVDAGVNLTAVAPKGRADSDCAGRGTFVAGIIAARPQDGSGFAGLAPAARILPVRVSPTEDAVPADTLAAGIRAAVDGRASVIAVTASSTSDSPALRAAVRDAVNRGAVVVAPATTRGQDRAVPGFPARYEEVLAVAAVGKEGTSGAPAAKVDLVAPGADGVVSLAATGNGHVTAAGDEVATAFVAGAAALVRSYRPELDGGAARRWLLDTAGRATEPGFGQGMVDPYRALTAVAPDDVAEPGPTPAQTLRLAPLPVPPRGPAPIVLGVLGGVAVVLAAAGTTALVLRRRRSAAPVPRTRSGSG